MNDSPGIKRLLNPYLIGYILIYAFNVILAGTLGTFNTNEVLGIFIIVGIGFSLIAWLVSRHAEPLITDKPLSQMEFYILVLLPVYISILLIPGNTLLFYTTNQAGIATEIITLCRKVLTFVLIPFFVYRLFFKFKPKDFGLSTKWRNVFNKKHVIIFIVMSLVVLALNYFGGRGAKPIREGMFSVTQLLVSIPLAFIWLFIEVGLVEEFFFRALLQNRLSLLLRSNIGAISITALIFGLVHAPGMYFRNAGAIEGLGSSPSLIACIGYCIAVQSVPGFFFGIIWSKTKNLWLLMGIHAAMDLLPHLPEFIKLWGI
jgi:membrane protease YdiL (CAAX protease family)